MDISIGAIQAKKISVGNTPIVKVSQGDVLVWPPVPTSQFCYLYAQGFNTASSRTLPLPFEAQAGQLCVCYNRAGSAPAELIPTGFTRAYGNTDGNVIIVVSYKILTPADITANSVTGMNGISNQMVLITYAGSPTDVLPTFVPITSVTVEYASSSILNTIPSLPQLNAVALNANSKDCVVSAMYGSSAAVTTQGWSGMTYEELYSTPNNLLYVKGHILLPTDTNLTVSMADNGNSNTLGLFVLRATI